MSKIVDFPADKIEKLSLDYDAFIDKMVEQSEKERAVVMYALRVLKKMEDEVENGTGSVVCTSNSDGDRTYYISQEAIRRIIQTELIAPV